MESATCLGSTSSTRDEIRAPIRKMERMANKILDTKVTAIRLRISFKNDFIRIYKKHCFFTFVEEKLCL
jgi:hypothetical protein